MYYSWHPSLNSHHPLFTFCEIHIISTCFLDHSFSISITLNSKMWVWVSKNENSRAFAQQLSCVFPFFGVPWHYSWTTKPMKNAAITHCYSVSSRHKNQRKLNCYWQVWQRWKLNLLWVLSNTYVASSKVKRD